MPRFLMPADSPRFTASGDSSPASNTIGQLPHYASNRKRSANRIPHYFL